MTAVVIIGKGKVGSATGLRMNPEPSYHDPHKGIVDKDVMSRDFAIVCVDTTHKSPADYEDMESVLDQIRGFSGIVLVRSTVSPEKITGWESEYGIKMVMFPEFLRQSDFGLDLKEPWAVILGGKMDHLMKAKELLIDSGYCTDESKYYLCTQQEASLIKLADNAFLSTKVTFFNAIYDICQRHGYDYETVRDGIILDQRVGSAHTIVPSPDDGMVGFGGHCLPKDLGVIAEIDRLNLFLGIKKINDHLRNIT